MRVLHVLHHSRPQLSGYSLRSSYILRIQREQGIDPVGVTSARQEGEQGDIDEVEGIRYMRTPPLERSFPIVRELQLMNALSKTIARAVREWQPSIIHAHSPVLVGLPAMRVAQRFGLPLVYEVRDLWENASVDKGKFKHGSPLYRAARELEGVVLRRADAVVPICERLRAELAPRVGKHTAVHVVGNGVEPDTFSPRPPSDQVRARYGLVGKRVLGYLGALQPWEGIPDLIGAMPAIVREIPNAHCVITGGYGIDADLKEQVRAMHLEAHVTFTGRVPHEQVQELIALAEVMVYPRILTHTTAMTTPLKPLEAMAMARPVLISDVPAMLELVKPGETGLAFRAGDRTDLANKCVEILREPGRAEAMGRNARAWIEQERNWRAIVAKYGEIYADLC